MLISSKRLAGAGLCLALLGACTADSSPSAPENADFVCTRADVPADFVPLVSGDFTPDDLAGIHDHSAQRSDALRAAGMEGGRFSYWKQTVEKPPFDPPANILCEALQFEGAASAASFVESLDPAREGDLPGFAWLPGGPRRIEEVSSGTGERTFRLEAADSDVAVHLAITYVQHDTRVIAIYVGGQSSRDELEQARDIQARLLQRVSNPARAGG